MEPSKRLQIVITAGTAEAARAQLGFEAALAARAAGLEVGVFLTLDAAQWACATTRPSQDDLVVLLIEQLRQLGVAITCCSRCAVTQCEGEGVVLVDGLQLVGLTHLMERVACGVPTVTF